MLSLKATTDFADNHLDEHGKMVLAMGHLVPDQFLKTFRKNLNANRRTPAKTFRLRRSVRYQLLGNIARITWLAPYAAAQEAGQANGRIFRNYTTPGTGRGFAQEALKMTRAEFMEDFYRANPGYRS